MAASNTKECIRECIGRTIIGVLFDACPPHRKDLSAGTKTFVFDDGTGLTFAMNGSFWQVSTDEITRAVRMRRAELDRVVADLKDVLAMAGQTPVTEIPTETLADA